MYDYPATLIRIIDGDTFKARIDLGFSTYRNETVRMSGINTPESRTRDLKEKRHGLAAKKQLSDILTNADQLVIVVKDVGKFGRALGIVYADGLDVNVDLINKGYAYPYGGERKYDYSQMLEAFPIMKDVYDRLEAEEK
jgi:micrococcal nuclease